MYVICRTDQGGGYLKNPRLVTKSCWTFDLAKARIFPTYESADRERCPENERVVAVADILQP